LALVLALLSSLCFGLALVTGRIGLRTLDARSGAAISIPTATLLLAVAAPFAWHGDGFSLGAALLFALVGLFFPAVVTLLTFRSNEELGPTVTSAVSGAAPLFALPAAALLLGERIPAQALAATVAVVAGVVLLTWRQDALRPGTAARSLLWPVSGAVVRGLAQVGVKAGLLLWPSAFAASLIGYVVSAATVVGVDRLGRRERARRTRRSVGWFALTGLLNGAAVLSMYAALGLAPVALVAPVVATYPLVTALASAAVLRDEPLTARRLAGATLVVAAIAYLVASGAAPDQRLPLLPERPQLGPLKPVTSARTSQSVLPNGQLLLTIDHDPIRGVSPAMLQWWFENLGKTMVHQGVTYPRYLLWHPRDHIHWELAAPAPDGGSGQGARFRIVEAFGANPDFYVDSTEEVEKLDQEGIALVRRELGMEVFRLEHRFGATPEGASYRSRMVVGAAAGGLGRVFNAVVRPRLFSDAMGTAWLTHNVEEVGMLEHMLPGLYERRGDGN